MWIRQSCPASVQKVRRECLIHWVVLLRFPVEANPPSSPPGGQFTATAVVYAPTAAGSYYSTGKYTRVPSLSRLYESLIIG